jgi:hypothetical protein
MSDQSLGDAGGRLGVMRLTRGAEQHLFRVGEPAPDDAGAGQLVRVVYGDDLHGHVLRVTQQPDGSLTVQHGSGPEVLVELDGGEDGQAVRARVVSDEEVAGHAMTEAVWQASFEADDDVAGHGLRERWLGTLAAATTALLVLSQMMVEASSSPALPLAWRCYGCG